MPGLVASTYKTLHYISLTFPQALSQKGAGSGATRSEKERARHGDKDEKEMVGEEISRQQAVII